jgi:hypothetical protein
MRELAVTLVAEQQHLFAVDYDDKPVVRNLHWRLLAPLNVIWSHLVA